MKEIRYISTRGGSLPVTASKAILKGIAEDGGLFVPETLPEPDWDFNSLKRLNYKELAYEVIRWFLTDYTEDELKGCIAGAYDDKFDTKEIAPFRKADGAYYLELYHGATIAFKDMALSLLPHLMTTAARKNQVKDEIVILTATSGDTGKAALAGFAEVPGTKIIVFYPKNGVSEIQERQMVTQTGDNTCVIGIEGNFDDAQTGVKKMFTDKALEAKLAKGGYRFSSANSINIGRLVPQVAYYVWSYCRLLDEGAIRCGDEIDFVVPTGNFGNILAAYYAKCMGLPVHRLICASNENKVLFDFFRTGTYDRNRDFLLTSSPSMDILISSNLERLIYRICGEDAAVNTNMMKALSQNGRYTITDKMKEKLDVFFGGYATEEESAAALRELFEKTGYCLDTHTAVAAAVYKKYRSETGADYPVVIVSTASPYKFAGAVLKAIRPEKDFSALEGSGVFAMTDELNRVTKTAIPHAVETIRNAPILHTTVCETKDMPLCVSRYLQLL